MGLFKQPDNPPVGLQALRAEQFGIDLLRGKTGTIGNNETGVTALRFMVDQTCRQLFATAIWTVDQHPAGGRCNARNRGVQCLDGVRLADNLRLTLLRRAGPQLGIFTGQPACL